MNTMWQKTDWRDKPRVQMPDYPDVAALRSVENTLSRFPPLVFAGEIRQLTETLGQAAQGHAFLLQGGDCAESFESFNANILRDTFNVLLQMAVVLKFSAKCPIIKVGRIAGQFAKPRSKPTEKQNDHELPTYRGDIINSTEFNDSARTPDPQRMIQAYTQSAASLNLLRAFSQGGYANLHRVHDWTLHFARGAKTSKYNAMASRIKDALDFIDALGLQQTARHTINNTNFYTSHEALLLEYEEALTRVDSLTGSIIAGSGHMLWIGDRTRQPNGAHVTFCKGVQNPIGLKCGPSLTCEDLKSLLSILNPDNVAGRLTLIARFGVDKIADHLPPLIKTVQQEGAHVVWCTDPMHGNTVQTENGYKTRSFTDILSEVQQFFAIHRAENTIPGGVHFEMTGCDVTECTGGIHAVSEQDLSSRYHTLCDPRLNANQALELAFLIAECLMDGQKA